MASVEAKTSEKRKVARVPVSMKVDSDEGKVVGFGYAQNISVCGMAIDAQALADAKSIPEVGTQLRVRFMLPRSNYVITVTGKVVWVEESQSASPKLALEFFQLDSEAKAEIARYAILQPSHT